MPRLSVFALLGFLSLSFLPPVAAQAQDYDSLIQDALAARNAGDFKRAEAQLRTAYELASDKSEATYLLAMVLAFQEQFLAARELINEGLQDHPENVDLRLAEARVMGFQSQFAEASARLDAILIDHPDNLEARSLSARLFLYQGQYGRAREQYLGVLAVEPDNLEALIGLYDLEQAVSNSASAENYLRRAQGVSPNHVDVVTRLERGMAQGPAVTQQLLVFSYAGSDFNRRGFDRWYDRAVEYRRIGSGGGQFFLRGEHDHRFGSHDTLAEVGFVLGENFSVPLEITVGGSDDAEFLPEHRWRVGTRWRAPQIPGGSAIFSLAYQQSKYLTGTTRNLMLSSEYYVTGHNFWFTPGVGYTEDENNDRDLAWNLGVHSQIGARGGIGLNYIDAPDTENNVTTDTRTIHWYARYQLTDALQLRMDYSRNHRRDSYTRENLALSLSVRF